MSNNLPPLESCLKYYGEENKKRVDDLISQVKALKLQLETRTPDEVDELKKEVEDLKEKLKSVNDAMNSINKIVSPQ